uniref:Putative small membrane protein n=1 Tax=Glossina morsitans morsitans TaxID=37546 RepID=D3TNC7_GLOMM
MTLGEVLHYIVIGNPVSSALINTTSSLLSKGGGKHFRLNNELEKVYIPEMPEKIVSTTKQVLTTSYPMLWRLAGRNYNFIRLAGLSGASAVILGAIGSHELVLPEKGELRTVFETANRFHFFHSIALLGVPSTKHPVVTGSLMIIGTALFCGALYYRAFTGNKPPYPRLAPLGGSCLIAAWLSLIL